LAGVLITLAGILLFQAIVFLLFGFETKGRTLEDVSELASSPVAGAAAGPSRTVAGIGG
jgi:putative MFS transporter